jgi:hypothetical protein
MHLEAYATGFHLGKIQHAVAKIAIGFSGHAPPLAPVFCQYVVPPDAIRVDEQWAAGMAVRVGIEAD